MQHIVAILLFFVYSMINLNNRWFTLSFAIITQQEIVQKIKCARIYLVVGNAERGATSFNAGCTWLRIRDGGGMVGYGGAVWWGGWVVRSSA